MRIMHVVADGAPRERVGKGIAGTSPDECSARKLARLSRWCSSSRRDAAEIELLDWQRSADCPAQAIALLAGLFLQTNRETEALALLDSHLSGEHAGEAILLCQWIASLTITRDARAGEAIGALYREHGNDPAVMRWLATLHAPAIKRLPKVPDATIDQLAGELLDHLDTIPSLVAAQRIVRDPRMIAMLRGAATKMLRDLDDDRSMLTACHALADLAMLADDHDDARRWAHRGLRIDPYAAGLAIILSRIADDTAIGPPASAVLKEAVNAHPKYPDLRAALIRREMSEGRTEVARRRLHQWLQREPNQRMALRLQQELAA